MLPGESLGNFPDPERMSFVKNDFVFGYGISVTTAQLAALFSFANNGFLQDLKNIKAFD